MIIRVYKRTYRDIPVCREMSNADQLQGVLLFYIIILKRSGSWLPNRRGCISSKLLLVLAVTIEKVTVTYRTTIFYDISVSIQIGYAIRTL